MIVYPRETPPQTRTAWAQPPAAHRRRHSRPHPSQTRETQATGSWSGAAPPQRARGASPPAPTRPAGRPSPAPRYPAPVGRDFFPRSRLAGHPGHPGYHAPPLLRTYPDHPDFAGSPDQAHPAQPHSRAHHPLSRNYLYLARRQTKRPSPVGGVKSRGCGVKSRSCGVKSRGCGVKSRGCGVKSQGGAAPWHRTRRRSFRATIGPRDWMNERTVDRG